MSPRQKERRQRIVETTLDLLKTAPNNVEVRDIVDASDVSLATVYRYFGSKEVLFAEVYLHWRAAHRPKVQQAIDKGRSDGDRLRLGVKAFIAPYRTFPRMFDLSNETRVSHVPEVVEVRRENEARTLTLFREAMQSVDDAAAMGIVMILIAVAALYLSQWRTGDISFRQVEEAIDRTIALTVDIREQR